MKNTSISQSFRFLTPAFAHGTYQARENNIPDLRAPSLRGQLRSWWRILGCGDGNDLFGSASGNSGTASRVQTRLESPPAQSSSGNIQLLPHKNQGPKNALSPLTDLFTLSLRPVRSGVSADEHDQLSATLEAWLLMGACGQRANRSAGSPWPDQNAPTTSDDYLAHCRSLLVKSTAKIALLDYQTDNPEQVRHLAGNFPSQSPGSVFGSAQPRKSSSLKLRAVYLDGQYRVAVLWIPKDSGDTPANLRAAINTMGNYPNKAQLGILLKSSLPALLGPSDPVNDLLNPPFVFDSIRLYKGEVTKWQAEGKTDLIARFRERTTDDKYTNLRKQPWYPSS